MLSDCTTNDINPYLPLSPCATDSVPKHLAAISLANAIKTVIEGLGRTFYDVGMECGSYSNPQSELVLANGDILLMGRLLG